MLSQIHASESGGHQFSNDNTFVLFIEGHPRNHEKSMS
jgi:hypothetical protein